MTSGCGTVQIRDSEWCSDLGEYGASCVHTRTTETRRVEKAQWDIERVGDVCTKAQSFADLKEAILKLCKKTGACTYAQKQMLNTFVDHVQSVSVLVRSSRL